MTRRHVLAGSATAGAGIVWSGMTVGAVRGASSHLTAPVSRTSPSFRISLNTGTLRGHKLPITEVIEVAAKTGYDGIEPWVDELDRHAESGGSLKDLNRRITDRGLVVTGTIAFFEWMVDDAARRTQGLDQAKRRMAQVAEIGGTFLAAPPAGDVKNVDLLKAAERYRELLDIGATFGVVPVLEIWGWAANLYRLGQAVMVAVESGHPSACILPDVYHLYKGGSGFSGIARLNANLLGGFHLNDYPADPPREKATDKDRVYPGEGVAPLKRLIQDLRVIGYGGPLSVELFNPEHARQDPFLVAKTAMEKTNRVIRAALER